MAKTETPTTPPLDPRRQLTLDEVLGNAPVRQFLRKAWQNDRLPHALLIHGPPGIGKTVLAWALAREVAADGGDPHDHPKALKVARGVHPDVLELTGAGSVSAMIRVDDIREMEDRVMTSPLEAPRRIILIEPADRMNEAAANALLKILEEPQRHLLFLLVTPEPGRLLDTIRSRCTPVRLDPVPADELTPWLRERTGLDETQAALIVSLAEGRPGYALGLSEAAMLGQRGEVLAALELLVSQGFASVFGAADRLMSVEADLGDTLTVAMTLLRDALVIRTRGREGVLNRDLGERLEQFAKGLSEEGLLESAERFERAAGEVPYFYTPQSKAHLVEVVLSEVGRQLRS